MYLSKLEIIGFKSFAQKTPLKFDAGMTAIVGPNGCGKTNVVDAIRWALGEQKAGTLRSDVMENVIFNGTRTRKPLGMAEVSLTIENTKGILPTEYSEVTITRRLFRSGESEYMLNKAQCRLKDIIELFMDTGMGANAYSVIELKMIETILSDRTEDRRKLFEEAAGVTKYKARRREALRRLDQVSADVARVDDIVKEVAKAVQSLERQAEKAKIHAQVSKELRTLEIELIEREFAQTVDKIVPIREKLSEAESNKSRINDELSKFESLLDVIEKEESEIEDQLLSSERSLREKSEIMQRTRETIIQTDERIHSLEAQKVRATQERERLLGEVTNLTSHISSLREALNSATVDRDSLESEKSAKESGQREAEQVVRNARAELQQARDQVYALMNERNRSSSDLERRRARIEELERRLNLFDHDYSESGQKAGQLEHDIELVTAEINEASTKIAQREQELTAAQDKKDGLKLRIEEMQNRSFALQSEIGKKLSKIEFFTGLVEQGTGAGEGTEFLLKETGWSSSEPITVADAITTDPSLRAAFESALGEAAHYLIVERSKDAFEAVDVLRHSQKGKATLVCLDRVPSQNTDPVHVSAGQSAFQSAEFDNKYRNLFAILLRPIAIVNTIPEAYDVLKDSGEIEKCVTLDGEVVTRSGFVRGGSKKSTEGILIGKREQIHDLEKEVAALKVELERHDKEIEELNHAFETINLREVSNQLRTAEEDRRRIQSRLSQAEYELKRNREQNNTLHIEEDKLKTDLTPLRESLAAIEQVVSELDSRHEAAIESSARAQIAVEEAERFLAEASRKSTEVQVKYAGLSSEVSRLESELRQAERSVENATEMSEQRLHEHERVERDLSGFAGKLDEFRQMLSTLEEEIAQATSRRDEVAELRKTKQSEAHKYREVLREERAEHERTINATHELELKLQELESKTAQLEQRAKEEFELEELVRKEFDEEPHFSFGDAREQVRELKQKIRNLGAVNLLAYDEFVQEKERLDFLTAQRKDLVEAQKNLVDTIEEINRTATQQFLDTFEKIRTNFQDIFRSLFTEGDECDLKLEEDKDPLEAQVEIIAKPRGKRPHSIELLSGGEKTMTAIALLFAIYLVKPSPFCILDEVDAPLDDSNIDRFLTIIRKFAIDTQFIVVTHNKRTMAAADALYGVTQEEDGVSKIVSVRLKREGQVIGGKKERRNNAINPTTVVTQAEPVEVGVA